MTSGRATAIEKKARFFHDKTNGMSSSSEYFAWTHKKIPSRYIYKRVCKTPHKPRRVDRA